MTDFRFRVPAMTCEHCVRAVQDEVGLVAGVTAVEVDLASKDVVVRAGDETTAAAIAAAIGEAGYEPVGL